LGGALFDKSQTTLIRFPIAGSGEYQIDPSFSLPGWRDAGLTIASGPIARPNSGGTISESACREAMGRVLDSLRAAGRVNAVFLRLPGAMYAEGIGPTESVLVKEVRRIIGPAAPIACTFDLKIQNSEKGLASRPEQSSL
jgi:microcystin degradation protein MlrC